MPDFKKRIQARFGDRVLPRKTMLMVAELNKSAF
jgi:hypothetical protein